MAALDKARPNLPVKPLPKKASAAAEKEDKAVRGTKAVGNAKNAVKKVSVDFIFALRFFFVKTYLFRRLFGGL